MSMCINTIKIQAKFICLWPIFKKNDQNTYWMLKCSLFGRLDMSWMINNVYFFFFQKYTLKCHRMHVSWQNLQSFISEDLKLTRSMYNLCKLLTPQLKLSICISFLLKPNISTLNTRKRYVKKSVYLSGII